jgi:predicted metal-dependent HD superfamily phosphohydrolase
VLRIGFVARLLARHGACAITAAISPYRAARDEVRARTERFLEVWCRAPVEALAARDPKGLYQKALRGEITGFTGVDDPYEEPLGADVVCETADEEVDASLRRILDALAARGWIGAGGALPPGRRAGNNPLVAPHGGALEERAAPAARRESLAAEARALVTLPVGGAVEELLDAFAAGLLSPLRGFTTQREDHAIAQERRLERGVAWPVRVRLTVPEEHPVAGAVAGTSIALGGRAGGAKAVVDVAETYRLEPRVVEIAGDVTVLQVPEGLASAEHTRRRLIEAGHRRVLGHVVRGGMIDRDVLRGALLLYDAVLLASAVEPAAVGALDLAPADRARVFAVRVPHLPARGPADAVLEIIALKNLGAAAVLIDPAPFASPGDASAERTLRAHLEGWSRASLGVDVAVLPSAEHDARRALEALAPVPLPAELLDEVAAAHRVGRRAYHDLAHVAAVARALSALTADDATADGVPLESFLAALFHDAVHEPGRRDDEARSAALARDAIGRWLPGAGVDVDRVAALVELTARHGHVERGDVDAAAAALLDADMAILGAEPDVFDRYEAAVAWEYAAAVPPDAWRAGRRQFLGGLLAAPRIFLGDGAHARLDARARENLRRALGALAAS